MSADTIIIGLSLVIVLSYLFGLVSRWSKVPSVLLLLGTGMLLRYVSGFLGFNFGLMDRFVEVFGVAGLIMIVLEASLDLRLSGEKMKLIRSSFSSAAAVLIVSSLAVALILHISLRVPFHTAWVYAVPFSIISSAIVIPSIEHLSEHKREFIIYESSFSDILGVLFFDYLTLDSAFTASAAVSFAGSLVLIVVASLVSTSFLLYLAAKLATQVKFFLLLAILFLLYAVGHLFHLPSLVLVLVFGITLSNIDIVFRPIGKSLIRMGALKPIVEQFRALTAETSFLIRTFFFILFGFSIDLNSLASPRVVLIGTTILVVLIVIRMFYFKYVMKSNLLPEVLLMPRGLITILLFYSIPERFAIPFFDQGILFYIIIGTSILMTLGLVLFRQALPQPDEL